ncbi:lipoyl(octanoyl) transferase LipB [Candidatus Synechococcus spongiarum]|uniref:Octanoyltransferase n=1 Tax=Candidatus Synechococcus spongiarum TaxID=431041 RepID=A0A164Z520_9SYNE|nr:lipoyl(octanoyl) transferase LipB [Candidatus Synechococcus spongiarum]SAY38914.1 Octanoate-[acyl-carrier-protein]-protein-N-octanoyltransferase [Candidatus Synechococcus spongiarum]
MRQADLLQLGLVSITDALAQQWQRQQQLLLRPNGREAVLLMQHSPCYTMGRGSSATHLRRGVQGLSHPLHHVDRGGEVTHHCPGQLVLWPVLNLQHHTPDLHWYLRSLEAVVLTVLAALGLPGERQPDLTGVWCGGRKVAAVGIGCRRWMTRHGLALNVSCSLQGFDAIVPCGLRDHAVGRLLDWRPGLTCAHVEPLLLAAVARQFNLELLPCPAVG